MRFMRHICLDTKLRWPECKLPRGEQSEKLSTKDFALEYLDLIVEEIKSKRSSFLPTRSSHKLSEYVRELRQLRRLGWSVFRDLLPYFIRDLLYSKLRQECTHSDQLRWGAISGMGKISAQLFLDFAEKEMLNEFLEKIVGKILNRTGWVRDDTEYAWKFCGGSFLLYLRTPSSAQTSHTDSPYVNTVSVLIPLTPACPLPEFYLLPHQTLHRLLTIVNKYKIVKVPEQDEVIADAEFRKDWYDLKYFC